MQNNQVIQRIDKLLGKLVHRGDQCRDLYPLETRLQFLNLATSLELDVLLPDETLSDFTVPQLETIYTRLQAWWQIPALARTNLSQELLRLSAPAGPALLQKNAPTASSVWSKLISCPDNAAARAVRKPRKIA